MKKWKKIIAVRRSASLARCDARVNAEQRLQTGKIFRNIFKSNPNQIVFTMHGLIWNQTDSIRLVPN